MKLLDVRHLSMWIHDGQEEKQILNDVTFSVDENESVAIVGESGSGKSQLMRAILQLQRNKSRYSGEILWKGNDVCKMKEDALCSIRYHGIAMMMQEPKVSLDPLFTVGYQMKECLMKLPKQMREQQCLSLLKQVKISDPKRILHSYPHVLSIGMCQRVWMAMLLASEAQLWITDEPTSSLDVCVQAEILELLNELRTKTKRSLIFITHDLRLVPTMCDRVIVMKKGNIHLECDAKMLYQQSDSYTKSLLELEKDK
ncbi:MAG: ABC transporter ATP-binding protein [Erysipelotrichaceae bacterium]|nr:ABC transporter ATP-binding protein [Erysipelotrichaceae bacterium]